MSHKTSIELRRHSMRNIPGVHLNKAGVTLARRIGNSMGKFNMVITSSLPRAYETAIAMGYAVDEQLEAFADMSSAIPWSADGNIEPIANAVRHNPAATEYVQQQLEILQAITQALPNNGTALVISHGGIVESHAIALAPEANHASWGKTFSYCEGARLWFEDERCVRVEILRQP